MTRTDPPGKGWFDVDGMQTGDRTLAEQLTGLDQLLDDAEGATVLDLGCAEGLISLEMMRRGAVLVNGIESVASRVKAAEFFFEGLNARFFLGNCERFATDPPGDLLASYDVVLMLSIAQKMRDPAAFITAAAARSTGMVALRLPAPIINDPRSGFVPVDVPNLMRRLGFPVLMQSPGPRGEWVGIFYRA